MKDSYSEIKGKKFFGSDFNLISSKATFVNQIKSSPNHETYLRKIFANFQQNALSKNPAGSIKKYTQKGVELSRDFSNQAAYIGCEFANKKYVAAFNKHIGKSRNRRVSWNVRQRRELFESLKKGAFGTYFQNPRFSEISRFLTSFHQGNQILASNPATSKL